jgi:hypothetical protein
MSLRKLTAMAIVSSAAGLAALGASPAAFAMAAPPPFAMDSIQQQAYLQNSNHFQLNNDEMKTIADTEKPMTRRICELSADHFAPFRATPVRVVSENGDQTVNPGQCANVHSRVLKMTPAGQLAIGEALTGEIRNAG